MRCWKIYNTKFKQFKKKDQTRYFFNALKFNIISLGQVKSIEKIGEIKNLGRRKIKEERNIWEITFRSLAKSIKQKVAKKNGRN